MDSLTHLLMGHAMGAVASTTAHPYGAAAYWAALIGNSIPDIDVPLSLLLRRDIKLHRTITHTVPGSLVLAGATALILSLFFAGAPLWLTFGWAFLGALVHMGMDCLNLFGAKPFWPLSSRPVEMGALHIMDPILMLMLSLPTLAIMLGKASHAALVLAFFMMMPYIIYRIATARRLYRQLQQAGSLRARIIPWFSSWRYVFETDTGIELGAWIKGKREATQTYTKQDCPLVRASLDNPAVAAFLKGADYPYAVVREDEEGHAVVWGDALRQIRADFRPLVVRVSE